MNRSVVSALVALVLLPAIASAQRTGDFCRGFEEGWKTIRGELAITPICPIEPVTPIGSNSFREGIKAGMEAGRRSGGRNTGGAPATGSRDEQRDFCNGFSEGWKSVKGDLAIVPICPIPPITPIGSTAYREGLKAGMARARR